MKNDRAVIFNKMNARDNVSHRKQREFHFWSLKHATLSGSRIAPHLFHNFQIEKLYAFPLAAGATPAAIFFLPFEIATQNHRTPPQKQSQKFTEDMDISRVGDYTNLEKTIWFL